MHLVQKINFQLLKLLRMSWFMCRYAFNKWKKIDGILIPVSIQYGYSVIRFINSGEYEQGEINIIRNTLQENDVVLELGTGIGFISAYCAKKVGNENVYTFEANAALEEPIRALYRKNNVRPQLTFALLGETAGTTIFYRNTQSFLASSISGNKEVRQEITQVQTLNLNQTISRIQPTYLMMDIEGGEYDIFKIIDFQTIQKIQFELHPEVLGEEKIAYIFKLLRDQYFVVDHRFSAGNNYYFTKN